MRLLVVAQNATDRERKVIDSLIKETSEVQGANTGRKVGTYHVHEKRKS